jgi:hypothetical protein
VGRPSCSAQTRGGDWIRAGARWSGGLRGGAGGEAAARTSEDSFHLTSVEWGLDAFV